VARREIFSGERKPWYHIPALRVEKAQPEENPMHSYSKSGAKWTVAPIGREFESEHEAAAFASFMNGGGYDPDAVEELLKPAEKPEEDEAQAEAAEKARLERLDPHEREAAAKADKADAKVSGYQRAPAKAETPKHATHTVKHHIRRSKRHGR
jgi:hypothetical protein